MFVSAGKPRKPAAHGFAHTLRQGALIPDAAAFVDVAQRLDEEERVAAGDRRQRPGELFVVVAGLGDVRGHVVLVEAAELKTVGGAVAVKIGEHRREGMGAVEVGAAVRADDLHARALAESQEVAQQQQCGLGCPVQVVEYQDDGRAGGGDVQQRNDGIEQCVALGVRIRARRRGEVGQDIGQPGNQWKQGLDAAEPPQPAGRRGRAPASAAPPRTADRAHRGPRRSGRRARARPARTPAGTTRRPGGSCRPLARRRSAPRASHRSSAVCHADRSRASSPPRPTNGPGPVSTAGSSGRSTGSSLGDC